MARPGTQIIARDNPPPRSAPVATGVWFVAGFTEKGAAGAHLVSSLNEFEDIFGSRITNGYLYDSLETFFREGGSRAYVSRVFGPAPVTADVDLLDGSSGVVFTVAAKSPGDWGNALNIAVLAGDAGGEYKLQVSHDTDGVLETSPSLADKAAGLAWAETSDYITLTSGASTSDPATVSATALTGGDDDADSATDATWEDALDFFTKDLGPGQVSFPGRATSTAHTALLAHAAANNRVAVLDTTNTTSKATMLGSASAVKALANARYGAMFGPWLTVPGLTSGTTRTVPASPVVAGLIARNESRGYNPNVPAAGELGVSSYALEPTVAFPDSDREDLNAGGVNLLRTVYGQVRVYGWRTSTDPNGSDAEWIQFSNARLNMAIAARGDAILEQFVFSQIDGRGHKLSALAGQLTGMLLDFYRQDALFGTTPDEAFSVDVGPQVNPVSELEQGNLRAVVAVRMSPFAELVTLELVRVSIQEALA